MGNLIEKQALGIDLPIVSGKRPTVLLPDGTKAQTSVCEIAEILCYQNLYFVTITTKNSIYRNINTSIYTPDDFMNGQSLSIGKSVKTRNGNITTVSKISEINQDSITIIDTSNNILKGKI